MADVLTTEQFEDTNDGLQAWLSGLGDMGISGPVSADGTPYTTVSLDFAAGDVDSAAEKFKSSVLELQGTNGFYIRILPSLSLGEKNVYTLRTRVAPKNLPEANKSKLRSKGGKSK